MKTILLDLHNTEAEVGEQTTLGVTGSAPHSAGNTFRFPGSGRPCANMCAENMRALTEDDGPLSGGEVRVNHVGEYAVVTDERVPPEYLNDVAVREAPGVDLAKAHARAVSRRGHGGEFAAPGEGRECREGTFTLAPAQVETYDDRKEENQGSAYSEACFRAAEEWMAVMERRMAQGDYDVQSYSRECFWEIDEGYTGFMHAAARSIVSSCWTYGETVSSASE